MALSKKETETILQDLEETFKAYKGGLSEFRKEPSQTIIVSGNADLYTEEQLEEYKEKGHITNQPSILDEIEEELISYELTNEQGEKITISNSPYARIGGGWGERNGRPFERIGFKIKLEESTYSELSGYIELEIKIPTDYEVKKISKNSVGKTIGINGQKMKILVYEGNALHFKLSDTAKRKFDIQPHSCDNNTREVVVSEKIYDKIRNYPTLDYKDSLEKYNNEWRTEFDKNQEASNYITVNKSDDYQFDQTFFLPQSLWDGE